jgi:hypothetical protein
VTASDWVTSILTGVLVLATIYYAKQTRATVKKMGETVDEMRLARESQLAPKLVPAIEKLGPNDLLPRIVNMGLGPGIRVKVRVTLEPNGPTAVYASPFMSPGHGASLFLHGAGRHLSHVSEFQPFASFRMEGECWDSLGKQYLVNEVFDLRGYISDFKAGMWARVPRIEKTGAPLDLMADALVNIEGLMRREHEAE